MIKRLLLTIAILIFLFLPHVLYAAVPDELDFKETFIRAKVIQIVSQGIKDSGGVKIYQQDLKIKFLEGPNKDKIVPISRYGDPSFGKTQTISENQTIVIDAKPDPTGKMSYTVYEPYRLDTLWYVLAGFVILVVGIAGMKGISSLIGLGISFLVIMKYIIPQILAGGDPLTICIIGCGIILILTTYIAHGLSLKTTIAVVGTGMAIIASGFLSVYLVNIFHVVGLGSEDIYNLQIGANRFINPQGLLLGGILIGTLGALNDITTTQSITIFTLVHENPKQNFSKIFEKGMVIGREHIASLINTLVLAYAGSSLAVFIFFELNPVHLPWWVILNNESTMEEIIRAIVGSISLVLVVPIVTLLAAGVALKTTKKV